MEDAQRSPNCYLFAVRTPEKDDLLGFVELNGILWNQSVGWLGIGIGDRDNWGRGIGTEVMRLALRFAFYELNLHRCNSPCSSTTTAPSLSMKD